MHQGQRIKEETDKKGREKEVSLYKKERCKGGKKGRDKTKKNPNDASTQGGSEAGKKHVRKSHEEKAQMQKNQE